LINQQPEVEPVKVTKIQDDGERFIIHGDEALYSRLKEVFDQIALGVSVTRSEKAVANILYTENNRDIILRMLNEHTE
jgi:hypothetical protein